MKLKIGNFKGPQGEQGEAGPQGVTGETGQRGSRWTSGTAITGTSTVGTRFPQSGMTDVQLYDYYVNTSTGNVYECTVPGNADIAEWVHIGNMKGPAGPAGSISDINDQKPTYEEAKKLENIDSGETVKISFGKLKKAVSAVIEQNHTLNAMIKVGGRVGSIKDFVEYVISDSIIKYSAGNVYLNSNILGIGGSWFEFIATWQNYYNQADYDIGLTVIFNGSSYENKMRRVVINGKNGSYVVTASEYIEFNADGSVLAGRAIRDGIGNVIADTYAKKHFSRKLSHSQGLIINNGVLVELGTISGLNIAKNGIVRISISLKLKTTSSSASNKFISIILYKKATTSNNLIDLAEFVCPLAYIMDSYVTYSITETFISPEVLDSNYVLVVKVGNSVGYAIAVDSSFFVCEFLT